jgi:phosphohistidine phosphatase
MKTIYLIRHAKSSWDDPQMDDFERPLNKRGKKDAPSMARRLKEKRVTPDFMLSSPATRALDTCKEFASILNYDKDKIKTDKRLYHASEDQILTVIRELKDRERDDEEVVLLFGHNPGLTEFANVLLNESIDNIPTCGIVKAHLKIERWKDASFGCGELKFFDFPKSKNE